MKRVAKVFFLLVIMLLISCTSTYNAGRYEATGEGRNGPIRVAVVIDSQGEISEIGVMDHSESDRMMGQVEKQLTPNMLEGNTWEVDGVSGATESSEGYKEAVKNALKEAK